MASLTSNFLVFTDDEWVIQPACLSLKDNTLLVAQIHMAGSTEHSASKLQNEVEGILLCYFTHLQQCLLYHHRFNIKREALAGFTHELQSNFAPDARWLSLYPLVPRCFYQPVLSLLGSVPRARWHSH